MSYERIGRLAKIEPVLHNHGYSTADCAVLFAIADTENTELTKQIDAGTLDPYGYQALKAWCRASAAYLAWKKGLGERFVRDALKKAEFDGLIEVHRRTKRSGGREKRSFGSPDWRRLHLPALQTLELDLPSVNENLDDFVLEQGKKQETRDLDFAPYVKLEQWILV